MRNHNNFNLECVQRLTALPAPELPTGIKREMREKLEPAGDFGGAYEPVRPRFCWRLPKKEAAHWFSVSSDEHFKAAHPTAYAVLMTVGILVLFLPAGLFAVAAFRVPGNENNGWIFLGAAGGFLTGMGLYNLVAAWMRQYLGHLITLACLLLGGGLMAFTWFFLL